MTPRSHRQTFMFIWGSALVLTVGGCHQRASKPRLAPSVSQGTAHVPALPPDSISQAVWDELHVPTNIITNDARLTGKFPRNLVVIMFHPTAPTAERQAAIDSIHGEVVGGIPLTPGGQYYVRIQDDGTAEPLFQAIEKLQSLAQVDYAMPEPPQGQQRERSH